MNNLYIASESPEFRIVRRYNAYKLVPHGLQKYFYGWDDSSVTQPIVELTEYQTVILCLTSITALLALFNLSSFIISRFYSLDSFRHAYRKHFGPAQNVHLTRMYVSLSNQDKSVLLFLRSIFVAPNLLKFALAPTARTCSVNRQGTLLSIIWSANFPILINDVQNTLILPTVITIPRFLRTTVKNIVRDNDRDLGIQIRLFFKYTGQPQYIEIPTEAPTLGEEEREGKPAGREREEVLKMWSNAPIHRLSDLTHTSPNVYGASRQITPVRPDIREPGAFREMARQARLLSSSGSSPTASASLQAPELPQSAPPRYEPPMVEYHDPPGVVRLTGLQEKWTP